MCFMDILRIINAKLCFKVGAGHAVTVIIVVCVGFLLFMVVLGVIRIRAAHNRSQQEDMADAEMAWDDSALNITVNPMEVNNKQHIFLTPASNCISLPHYL